MDFVQIEGKEIPLLEAPQHYEDPPRRILYVLFKHKQLICVIFILLIAPMFFYLLFRPRNILLRPKYCLTPAESFSIYPQRAAEVLPAMYPVPEDHQYRNSNY